MLTMTLSKQVSQLPDQHQRIEILSMTVNTLYSISRTLDRYMNDGSHVSIKCYARGLSDNCELEGLGGA